MQRSISLAAKSRRSPEDVLNNAVFQIGGIQISQQQIYIIAVTLILMLALTYIIGHTRMGRAMRAVSVDEKAAELMGISVDRTISFTFLLGSVLAGAAACSSVSIIIPSIR